MKKFHKLDRAAFLLVKGEYSIALSYDGILAGFVIFRKYKSIINIIKISVLTGQPLVAQDLIEKLCEKMGELGKSRMEYVVPEKDLEMLSFLRESGFVAVQVLRDFYENEAQDGFRMVFSIENDEKAYANA